MAGLETTELVTAEADIETENNDEHETRELVSKPSFNRKRICTCKCCSFCVRNECICRYGDKNIDLCCECDCCCDCCGLTYCLCNASPITLSVVHSCMIGFGIFSYIWWGYNNIVVAYWKNYWIVLLVQIWFIYILTIASLTVAAFAMVYCNCCKDEKICKFFFWYGFVPSKNRYFCVLLSMLVQMMLYLIPLWILTTGKGSMKYQLNNGIIQNTFTDYYNGQKLDDTHWKESSFNSGLWGTPGPYLPWGEKENGENYKSNDELPKTTVIYRDNLKLHIYLPDSLSDNIPFIMYFSGSGWIIHYDTEHIDPFRSHIPFEYWIERGFGFITVEYGGTPQYNIDQILENGIDAYRYIVTNGNTYGLNVSRMVLMGRAEGGHIATYVGYNVSNANNTNIRGIINIYGFTRWDTIENGQYGMTIDLYHIYQEIYSESFGYKPNQNDFDRISSLNQINMYSPQTLTFQGRINVMVPRHINQDLHKKLTEYKITNKLLLFKTFGHEMETGFYSLPNQMMRYAIERFIAIATI